jgi:hypothetical protein
MVFVMLESTIFDFHERCWALHSLGGGSNTEEDFNKQQVREPFCIASQLNLPEVKPT